MADLPTGTVTLLFTDIEGSTRLLQQQGEHYGTLLDKYRDLLRTIVQAHGGHEWIPKATASSWSFRGRWMP